MSGCGERDRHAQRNTDATWKEVCFRQETRTTLFSYLNRIRMNAAARLLASTEMKISDISEKVGIMDSNYFTKCFKKEYRMTPAEYRRRFANQ